LEQALEGRMAGQRHHVELRADSAYGPRDEGAIVEVDPEEFPPDVAAGDRYEVENAAGALLIVRVLDVGPSAVTIDLNHPLAGQRVHFDVEITAVRPATHSEIEAAEKSLESQAASKQNLLAPERLLRGPDRR
jgi:FKBP-type peptidyl-prolyl cis-trans isomerase SlyD